MANLSPADLFQESRAPENSILLLPSVGKLADVFPASETLRDDDKESIKKAILARAKMKAAMRLSVILVVHDRFNTDELIALARLAKPATLLFYNDSELAYRQFLRTQNAMWAKQVKGPTKPVCGAM